MNSIKTLNLHGLRLLSAVYMLIPYFLFFVGWTKLTVSVVSCCILLYLLYSYSKNSKDDQLVVKSSHMLLLLSGTLILMWVLLSGAGGVGYQNADYDKHNAILSDLVNYQWPVTFHDGDNHYFLVYYIAYYLPSAFLGKFFGIGFANFFIFIWTFIGVILAFLWFSSAVGKISKATMLIFILFSGLDFIGNLLLGKGIYLGTQQLEFWTNIWQYSSNTVLLYWVPQQAVAGWIVVMMMFDEYKKGNSRNIGFLLFLTVLWSPLVSLGLIPFVLLFLIKFKIKDLLSIQNILSALLAIVFLLYFLSGESIEESTGFIWEFINIYENWNTLIIFIVVEMILYVWIIKSELKDNKAWLTTITIFLCVLPIYHIGLYNDLVMRSSIPSLFILMTLVTQVYLKNDIHGLTKKLLVICLILGSFTAIHEVARGIEKFGKPQEFNSWGTIMNAKKSVINQYIGKNEGFFCDYFLKK